MESSADINNFEKCSEIKLIITECMNDTKKTVTFDSTSPNVIVNVKDGQLYQVDYPQSVSLEQKSLVKTMSVNKSYTGCRVQNCPIKSTKLIFTTVKNVQSANRNNSKINGNKLFNINRR